MPGIRSMPLPEVHGSFPYLLFVILINQSTSRVESEGKTIVHYFAEPFAPARLLDGIEMILGK